MRHLALCSALFLCACSGSGLADRTHGYADGWTAPGFRADHVALFADQGDEIVFPLDVPEGTTVLYVATRGGSGNADLVIRTVGDAAAVAAGPLDSGLADTGVSESVVLCESRQIANEESCVVWDPPAGALEIVLEASVTFVGVDLDFEMETDSSTPTPVPTPQGLLIAQPSSIDDDLDVDFGITNRHGVLEWSITPADAVSIVYDATLETFGQRCHREEVVGPTTCRVAHPKLGDWTATTTHMGGGAGELRWAPLPLLVEEVTESPYLPSGAAGNQTQIVTLPPGATDALFEVTESGGSEVHLVVSRAGIVLCDTTHQGAAWCRLEGAAPGDYEVTYGFYFDRYTLRVSADQN
ncbi:MAG: hypothetical protein R3F61_30055 [Myxococcota bacterium]